MSQSRVKILPWAFFWQNQIVRDLMQGNNLTTWQWFFQIGFDQPAIDWDMMLEIQPGVLEKSINIRKKTRTIEVFGFFRIFCHIKQRTRKFWKNFIWKKNINWSFDSGNKMDNFVEIRFWTLLQIRTKRILLESLAYEVTKARNIICNKITR